MDSSDSHQVIEEYYASLADFLCSTQVPHFEFRLALSAEGVPAASTQLANEQCIQDTLVPALVQHWEGKSIEIGGVTWDAACGLVCLREREVAVVCGSEPIMHDKKKQWGEVCNKGVSSGGHMTLAMIAKEKWENRDQGPVSREGGRKRYGRDLARYVRLKQMYGNIDIVVPERPEPW